MLNTPLALTDTLISTVATGSPAVHALTLAYAKLHIRSLGTSDDALVTTYIDAAASYFENQTGRQLLTATREVWLDAFPALGASGMDTRIELPHPPLQSVVSVTYLDGTGVLQTYGGSPTTINVRAPRGDYARRGWVEPAFGSVWPIAQAATGAIRIRYLCGYGDTPDTIPPLARGVLCYLVGHFDTYRSAVHPGPAVELPFGMQQILSGFRYSALPSQVLRTYPVPLSVLP